MKLINLLLIIMIVLADIVICTIEARPNDHNNDHELESSRDEDVRDFDRFRFFWPRKHTRRQTCKKYPRVCLAKGSPGPNCCKKKCVDLLRDRHNCGKCGKKCKYNKICCNGKCVNPSFNRKHCGGCNNRCSNKGICAFGLCNYS